MVAVTRRHFLETTIAGSIPIVISSFGGLPTTVTSQHTCSSRLRGWDDRRLSNAVLDHVGRELGWVYNSIQSRGSAIANEVKSVIASMRLLFTHLNEIRLTRVLEQQMRECRQEILDFVPQEEHLRVIQDRLVAFRVSVPLEQLRQILTVPYERKARVLSDVEIFGINHFVRRALGALNLVAVRLEGPRTIKVGIEPQDCPPEPGDTCICVCGVDCPPWYDPYCRLGDPCFALREALNIMAIMAAAYGVAALFFLPAAVIAAELVLFIAIGEYLYDQMC